MCDIDVMSSFSNKLGGSLAQKTGEVRSKLFLRW